MTEEKLSSQPFEVDPSNHRLQVRNRENELLHQETMFVKHQHKQLPPHTASRDYNNDNNNNTIDNYANSKGKTVTNFPFI